VNTKERIRELTRRLRLAHDEIRPLSLLIKAMFNDVRDVTSIFNKYYESKFDHLDPEEEQLLNKRHSYFEVEGDFYLVRNARSGYVYIVFGDATGHFAYAGGLKLFIAMGLKRIFDRHLNSKTKPLTAEQVVMALDDEFQRVGRAALRDNRRKPLEHGANLIVIRIHPADQTADYASAGIPARAIMSDGTLKQYGEMLDAKSLMFPSSLRPKRRLTPEVGTFSIDQVAYLAFVTDGFQNLGRSNKKGTDEPDETMGHNAIDKALLRPFKQKPLGELTASHLVDSVIRQARNWRRNYFVPETTDDDRLVLVFDVRRFRVARLKKTRRLSQRINL